MALKLKIFVLKDSRLFNVELKMHLHIICTAQLMAHEMRSWLKALHITKMSNFRGKRWKVRARDLNEKTRRKRTENDTTLSSSSSGYIGKVCFNGTGAVMQQVPPAPRRNVENRVEWASKGYDAMKKALSGGLSRSGQTWSGGIPVENRRHHHQPNRLGSQSRRKPLKEQARRAGDTKVGNALIVQPQKRHFCESLS